MFGSSEARAERMDELAARCFIVRARMPNVGKVRGLAMDQPGKPAVGYSSDLLHLDMPEWTEANEAMAVEFEQYHKYFESIDWSGGTTT